MSGATARATALCLLLLAPAAATAQDSADVFDPSAFDQNVQKSAQEEQKNGPQTQFGGNLLYDTSVTTPVTFDGYGVSGSFSGKAFVKVSVPDTGAVYIATNFTKNLYQGAAGAVPGAPLGLSGPVLSQPAGDLYGVSFELAEFYASVDIAKAVYLRIGNQLLAWGPSVIWTPVDFVNLQRANPLSPLDLRVGKPGIKASIPLGPGTAFVFADLSRTVTPTGSGGALKVNDPGRTTAVAGRYDLTTGGFELGFSGLTGTQTQSRAGLDAAGRLLGFDVYAEAAAALPTAAADFSWSTSVGLQKSLGELSWWSVAGELYYNDAGTSDVSSYPGLAASQELDPFYVGRLYAYASVTRSHLFVDGVSATLAGFTDLSDGSFLARMSTTIRVPRVPPFTFSLSWAGGGVNKAFTWFMGDNSLTAELQMTVAF